MRQYRLDYFKDIWNCIDLIQFCAFIYLFFSKLHSQFQSDSDLEILFSALVLFLSIYKVLYFIRIYDKFNEVLIIIHWIGMDFLPFGVVCIFLLFALSKIYQVLHMGVNDPQGFYKQINS